MLTKTTKIFLVLLPIIVAIFMFLSPNNAQAVTACSVNSVFNAKPFWGNNPSQTVNADKGSRVAITFEGEDGCAGMVARFGIYTVNNPDIESVVSVTLNLGSAVLSKPGMFFLTGDWTIDLNPGTYGLTLKKVGNNLFGGVGISPNQLIVKAKQDCNISKVYVNPAGGKPGEAVQLIVEAQGSCQGWKASLNIVNIDPGTPASRLTPFQGSPQDISLGKVIWSWTFPALSSGRQRDNYQASANLGSQIDIRSSTFCVGSCGSDSGSGIVPGKPGTDISLGWGIKNPLVGNPQDVFGVLVLVSNWLLNIAGTLVVILIIYSGVRFMISKGNPSEYGKAKDILKWALIGFAVILIGKGFVFIVDSVLRGQLPF